MKTFTHRNTMKMNTLFGGCCLKSKKKCVPILTEFKTEKLMKKYPFEMNIDKFITLKVVRIDFQRSTVSYAQFLHNNAIDKNTKIVGNHKLYINHHIQSIW